MKTLPLVLAALLAAALLSGCGAVTQYRLSAIDEVGKALDQLQLGADEARAGLGARLEGDETRARAALTESMTLVAAAADVPAEEKARLVSERMEKFWTAVWGPIQTDRARADERFRRMAEQNAHARLILADLLTIERQQQDTEAKLQEYRVLAEQYARGRLGLSTEGGSP